MSVRDSNPTEGTISVSPPISLGNSDDQNVWADREKERRWFGKSYIILGKCVVVRYFTCAGKLFDRLIACSHYKQSLPTTQRIVWSTTTTVLVPIITYQPLFGRSVAA